ncbi:MAG: nuclear transport factor 2 family protein [Chloroflexota bacterium]
MLKQTLILILCVVLVGCTTASIAQAPSEVGATPTEQIEMLVAKDAAVETVTRLMIATDELDWETVQTIFTDEVFFDMTSLVGGDPLMLSAQSIVDSWDEGLRPLEAVHHQVSNFVVTIEPGAEESTVFNYGIAIHYLPNPTGENTRTFVGTYTSHLTKVDGDWRIDEFKFDAKYVDGNLDLEADAAEASESDDAGDASAEGDAVAEKETAASEAIELVPAAPQCYIDAVNAEDLETLTSCFTDDAVIIDVSRSIDGVEAIRTWVDREVIGGTLEVLETVEESDSSVKYLVIFAPGGTGGFRAHYEFTYADGLITGMDLQYAP